eukprot:591531-Prymnesium_polylepis.1
MRRSLCCSLRRWALASPRRRDAASGARGSASRGSASSGSVSTRGRASRESSSAAWSVGARAAASVH